MKKTGPWGRKRHPCNSHLKRKRGSRENKHIDKYGPRVCTAREKGNCDGCRFGGLANVNVVLGVIPKYNLYHLIRKQKSMKEIILDTNYGIQIVAGASGFSKVANLSEEERTNFIEELSELAVADISS